MSCFANVLQFHFPGPLWKIACVALFTVAPAHAQFEGIVRSRNITQEETGRPLEYTMVMWVKGDRLRVETSPIGEEPGSLIIYRTDLGCYWIVDHADRSYIEVRRVAGETAPAQREEGTRGTRHLKRTGKSRRLLGYTAVQMTARDGEVETELWGTSELAPLVRSIATTFGDGGSAAGGSEMTREFAAMGMYPLIARIRLGGKVIEESEVTAIERVHPADSLFVLPAGYKKQVMEEMFEGPGRR